LEKRTGLLECLQVKPPEKLLRSPLVKVDLRDGMKFVAEDSTWLMLRGSGTEPGLRIYAEAKPDADVQKLLKLGVRLTQSKIFR
jgi:phosphomannomutase